ncbi:unnamed protein product [Candidula unifasciata]|uniref:Uncharacterized protein n=1 Tax=Candidula unifasciata TaxID=100452 RepID=A0A8S3YR02_9EUPU|nr:unnamed protein product [Candidula unifasciata]
MSPPLQFWGSVDLSCTSTYTLHSCSCLMFMFNMCCLRSKGYVYDIVMVHALFSDCFLEMLTVASSASVLGLLDDYKCAGLTALVLLLSLTKPRSSIVYSHCNITTVILCFCFNAVRVSLF